MQAAEVCMGLCKKICSSFSWSCDVVVVHRKCCGSEFDLRHVIPIPVLLHLSKLSNDIKAKAPKIKQKI